MKELIVVVVFSILNLPLNAQNQMEIYLEKALSFEGSDIDSALHYFNLLAPLAFANQDTSMVNECFIFRAEYYNNNSEFEKAITICEKSLPFCKDTLSKIIWQLNYAGALEISQPEVSDSIYKEGIELVNAYSQELVHRGTYFNNYAYFLLKRGELDKSAQYFQRSIELAPNPFRKYQSYLAILNVFEIMGNDLRIAEYIQKAIDISDREQYKSRNGLLALYNTRYLLRKEKIDAAKLELDRAINYTPISYPKEFKVIYIATEKKYSEAIQDWSRLDSVLNASKTEIEKMSLENHPYVLLAKANVSLHKGLLAKAEQDALAALKFSATDGFKFLQKDSHKLLGEIYTAKGNYQSANTHIIASERLANETYRNNQSRTVTFLEAEHNRKEQEFKIENLNLENKAKAELVAQQRQRLTVGGITLGLISLLSFFLFRLYTKVNSQKEVISKALSEKDILLREIHHRVKNNLQLVSSLLTLQGRSIDDKMAIEAINEGKSRVRSMALIHQDLYNKENLTDIGVKNYLEKLTQELFATYQIDKQQIALELDIQDIELDVDTLVPLGLIINELITNSLKYAFPEGRNGKLSVVLKELNQNDLLLKVSDDGIGYDSRNVKENSFGATLVEALSEQLGGELEIQSDAGTQTKINFSNHRD